MMQTSNNPIVTMLTERREAVASNWLQTVGQKARGRASQAETERELLPLLDALLIALQSGEYRAESPVFDEVRALLSEYSRSRARQGFSPSETALAIFALKEAVLSTFSNGDTAVFGDFPQISKLIDDLGLITFEAFTRAREEIISNQTEQLLELSTPVVRLWDGILAVPLVGTLDSGRTQVVMESLLAALVSSGSSHAIIDITGVPAVDTQVAQHLLKAVAAARLMGAECIISGIRPQIAQTIVALGISFGETATKATLADALKMMLQRSGLEVRKVEKRA